MSITFNPLVSKKEIIGSTRNELPVLAKSLQVDSVSFTASADEAKRKRLLTAHGIIHTAAAAAGTSAFCTAQIPGVDESGLTVITTGMALGIARLYGVSGTSTLGVSVAAVCVGASFGERLASYLYKWIPVAGNWGNAASTVSLHESSGWALVALFEQMMEKGKKIVKPK